MARGGDRSTRDPSQATNPGPSLASTEETRSTNTSQDKRDKSKSRFRTKMHKIADWLSTSEPSSQALKQHKKDAFQKAGISLDDTEANSKLHAPIGEIPPEAIKPTTGPSPEEVLKKKAEQQRKLKQQSASTSVSVSMSGASGSIQSPSWSGYSSASRSSPKGSVSVPPDDDFGANGWGPR